MNNLYLTPQKPDFITKTAAKRLSRKSEDWSKEIIDTFYDDYPAYQGQDLVIKFRHKDVERGYAVGIISIPGFTLPFIIKGFSLFPLDVAINQVGNMVPFNNNILNLEMSGASPFKQVDMRNTEDMFNLGKLDRGLSYTRSIPSNTGLGYVSKVASMIAENGGAMKEDLDRIVNTLKSDDGVKLAYDVNPDAVSMAMQYSALPTLIPSNFDEVLSDSIDRDIYMLTKTGQFKYELVLGSSKLDDPILNELDETDFLAGLPPLRCAGTARKLEKLASVKPQGVAVNGPGQETYFITKTGSYCVIPNVFDRVVDEDNSEILKTASEPQPGDYGIFVSGDRVVSAISPLVGIGSMAYNGESVKIAAQSVKFNTIELVKTASDKAIVYDENPHTIYIPSNAKFIKLGKRFDYTRGDLLGKSSAEYKIFAVSDDRFSLRGKEFNKYAARYTGGELEVTKKEATWALIQMGGSTELLSKLASLRPDESLDIDEALTLPPNKDEFVKTASELNHSDKQFLQEMGFSDDYWVKLAAWMPDPESVDMVLGMNFLNKTAIPYFVELIPELTAFINKLTQLMFATRMGLAQIDESPMATALVALSKVLELLIGLQKANRLEKTAEDMTKEAIRVREIGKAIGGVAQKGYDKVKGTVGRSRDLGKRVRRGVDEAGDNAREAMYDTIDKGRAKATQIKGKYFTKPKATPTPGAQPVQQPTSGTPAVGSKPTQPVQQPAPGTAASEGANKNVFKAPADGGSRNVNSLPSGSKKSVAKNIMDKGSAPGSNASVWDSLTTKWKGSPLMRGVTYGAGATATAAGGVGLMYKQALDYTYGQPQKKTNKTHVGGGLVAGGMLGMRMGSGISKDERISQLTKGLEKVEALGNKGKDVKNLAGAATKALKPNKLGLLRRAFGSKGLRGVSMAAAGIGALTLGSQAAKGRFGE